MTVGGIDAGRLRSFVERIQRLDEEAREVTDQIAEIYNEASVEFDKKALKLVVGRLRKQRNEVDELDFLVEQYERALGVGDRGEPPTVVKADDLPDGLTLAPAPARARTRGGAPQPVPRHEEAYAAGRADGLNDVRDNAGRWPSGEPGHGDYELGFDDGRSERIDREMEDTLPPAASASRAGRTHDARAREEAGT